MLDTPPKFTIFGDQKVKADPMSRCGEGNCLVWRSRPLTIFGRPFDIVLLNDPANVWTAFWKIPEGQGWSPDHPDSRISLPFWPQLS